VTYEQYLAYCAEAATPEWRTGQTYFNVLYQVRPDLSEAIRCTNLDPYHNDTRLPAFLHWVETMWNAKH
jgi:hypothetical protein